MIKRIKDLYFRLFRTKEYYDKLFYSQENQKRLKELIQELEDGKGEYHELIED